MSSSLLTLSKPRTVFDETKPFDGDLFERQKLADRLTGYIDRLKDGAVLAIDAPWGEGKSWFGKHWAADLKVKDYHVIYLDAFQQDYIEDPFLLIASEINELITKENPLKKDLKERAASIMTAILPFTTKALINVAGRVALGNANIVDDFTNAMAESSQRWVESKIDEYANEKASIKSFREILAKFCNQQDKPVVFFIDELDRCRPDFSVKLIERLKHFFDVPNLVFVLLLNNDQLEKAIKGVYGADTDATAYLGKFINLHLRLPKKAPISGDYSNANLRYIHRLFEQYKFDLTHSELEETAQTLAVFASAFRMSLRDLEKAVTLLAINGMVHTTAYLAWPISLKVKCPKIFDGILHHNPESHREAAKLLALIKMSNNSDFWAKDYFHVVHCINAGDKVKLTDEQIKRYESLQPNAHFHGQPLVYWLRLIDLDIQN